MINEKTKAKNNDKARSDKAVKLSGGLVADPEKKFKLTKENEKFVDALIKMRNLIASNYYYAHSTGSPLPFYEVYKQKYYNDAHL